eukprot:CAMPEP_0183354236 /NCGR_PEP_ID=MMETSP0164_2-20130417/37194_1 /TAXON_ID=221442 /ORGANISM="Coccolithus pelagicus ssp braarudi, Strain PLY182g" /LENGTH=89 /DNA_ID=CAMNT_0025527087 /DNA_START=146 /DNA_END=414 /DNA_ORIENTATION=-
MSGWTGEALPLPGAGVNSQIALVSFALVLWAGIVGVAQREERLAHLAQLVGVEEALHTSLRTTPIVSHAAHTALTAGPIAAVDASEAAT